MDDLVKRLRSGVCLTKDLMGAIWQDPPKIQVEAADRIEELEAALREIAEWGERNPGCGLTAGKTAHKALGENDDER